ncbi:hypothetical protein HMPREF1264_01450, partial [Corynebacterium sp. KPL1821]
AFKKAKSNPRDTPSQTHILTLNPKIQLNTPYMGNDAVPLQRRVVPIPYHSQRIGETVCLPPK